MTSKPLLDAGDLQRDWGLNRRQAYAVLHEIGVHITPRRLVVLRERLLDHLGGLAVPDHSIGEPDEAREAP